MHKPTKVFIVEGPDDYRFAGEMTRCFFKGSFESKIIMLPAEMNIYMLYRCLTEDNFETDVIEVLKERSQQLADELKEVTRQEVDEVYLFFDYDIHQKNLPGTADPHVALSELFRVFDNETENGKLYLSYPMVEAVYDYNDLMCQSRTDCIYPIERLTEYKEITAINNPNTSQRFKIESWQAILAIFGMRISCLFDRPISFIEYRQIMPSSIYEKEKEVGKKKKGVFVLSAFPEF